MPDYPFQTTLISKVQAVICKTVKPCEKDYDLILMLYIVASKQISSFVSIFQQNRKYILIMINTQKPFVSFYPRKS